MDVEELFPPKPGGMVDTARKAAQGTVDTEPSPVDPEVADGEYPAVRTVPQGADRYASRSLSVAAGSTSTLLPEDRNRKRATVLASSSLSQNSTLAYGLVNGPTTAGEQIAATPTLPAGTYSVVASVWLSGTTAAIDGNNTQLVVGSTVIGVLPNPSASGTLPPPTAPIIVTVPAGGATISVQVIAPGTSTANYRAQLTVNPVSSATTSVVLSQARGNADSGKGFVLPLGVPVPVEGKGMLYVNNPGGSSVTVSVLSELYAPGV